MKHNGHPMDGLTDIKSLTDVLMPHRPQHMGCIPHITCRYTTTYTCTGEHTDVWGC